MTNLRGLIKELEDRKSDYELPKHLLRQFVLELEKEAKERTDHWDRMKGATDRSILGEIDALRRVIGEEMK